ncbi:hypothetical protein AG1IA_09020 [Rhizoctonia solani AG-1 IA]|uniref:Uncharacterized protein n=1 Tax=Thanatephorus cucumeris (strain AG1-IA) TaxID=983506 RepID=L8WG58_THACA|nr:hypothetical protein AG1IA_09020 [Rhizoctonia solani AG-1 IA]
MSDQSKWVKFQSLRLTTCHSLNVQNTSASTEPVGQESQSTQVLDQLQSNEQSNALNALGDPEPEVQQNTINQDPTGNTVCGQNVFGKNAVGDDIRSQTLTRREGALENIAIHEIGEPQMYSRSPALVEIVFNGAAHMRKPYPSNHSSIILATTIITFEVNRYRPVTYIDGRALGLHPCHEPPTIAEWGIVHVCVNEANVPLVVVRRKMTQERSASRLVGTKGNFDRATAGAWQMDPCHQIWAACTPPRYHAGRGTGRGRRDREKGEEVARSGVDVAAHNIDRKLWWWQLKYRTQIEEQVKFFELGARSFGRARGKTQRNYQGSIASEPQRMNELKGLLGVGLTPPLSTSHLPPRRTKRTRSEDGVDSLLLRSRQAIANLTDKETQVKVHPVFCTSYPIKSGWRTACLLDIQACTVRKPLLSEPSLRQASCLCSIEDTSTPRISATPTQAPRHDEYYAIGYVGCGVAEIRVPCLVHVSLHEDAVDPPLALSLSRILRREWRWHTFYLILPRSWIACIVTHDIGLSYLTTNVVKCMLDHAPA